MAPQTDSGGVEKPFLFYFTLPFAPSEVTIDKERGEKRDLGMGKAGFTAESGKKEMTSDL